MSKKTLETQGLSPSAKMVSELVRTLGGGSQRKFARLVGCAQPVISRIVRGEQQPGRDLLERIAKVKGVDRDALMATLVPSIEMGETANALVPVFDGLLNGSPAAQQGRLTGETVAVAPLGFRPTLYAVRARACASVLNNEQERMLPNDLVIIESHMTYFRKDVQSLNRRLCVIDQCKTGVVSITLKRVWVRCSEDGEGGEIRTLAPSGYPTQREKRAITLEEPEVLQSEKVGTSDGGGTAEVNPPDRGRSEVVSFDDIVGVATQLIRKL